MATGVEVLVEPGPLALEVAGQLVAAFIERASARGAQFVHMAGGIGLSAEAAAQVFSSHGLSPAGVFYQCRVDGASPASDTPKE
jgi:hypothetical protein